MNEIVIRDFHFTQRQDNPYDPRCTMEIFSRCSPHRTSGLLNASQQSYTAFTSFTPSCIVGGDGFFYFFRESGAVWKYDVALDTETLVHTITSTDKNVRNARVHDGYIYYATKTNLGRASLSGFGTPNDTFGTFSVGDNTEFHVMAVVDQTLYIGDGNLVAIVDPTGTFVASGLDIPDDYEVTALYDYDRSLMIGTRSAQGTLWPKVNGSKVFRWNTWSVSFDMDIFLSEDITYSFFLMQGNLYLFTGNESGYSIYAYGEPACSLYSSFPYDGSDEWTYKDNTVQPMNTVEVNGKVYIMMSATSSLTRNNSYMPGLWTFYSRFPGEPPTLQLEHHPDGMSFGSYGLNMNSLGMGGGNYLAFGWGTSVSGTGTIAIGVDIITFRTSNAKYNSSFRFTTGWIRVDQFNQKAPKIEVHCSKVPTGVNGTRPTIYCTMYGYGDLSAATDGDDLVLDDSRNIYHSQRRFGNANMMKFSFTVVNPVDLNDRVSDSLEVESIKISFD